MTSRIGLIHGLLYHYWLALTARHNRPLGRFGTLHTLTVVVTILVALVRWTYLGDESAYQVLFKMALLLSVVAQVFSPRMMVLYAMVSTVIDLVAIALLPLMGHTSFLFYEMYAVGRLAYIENKEKVQQ